jgi:hypothetical protein
MRPGYQPTTHIRLFTPHSRLAVRASAPDLFTSETELWTEQHIRGVRHDYDNAITYQQYDGACSLADAVRTLYQLLLAQHGAKVQTP